MEGTRTAILEDIASWVAKSFPHDTRSDGDDSSNMFWLYGIPGIGKTSVANSLCDRLRRSGNLAGGFFCRRYDPVLCEPKRVLPTLIYKLVEMWGPFRKEITRALHDDPQLNPESTRGELLLKALRSLKRYPSRTLVLVIDALDECGEPDTRAPLLQSLKEAGSRAPWLKIIVTSRPEYDITSFFNQHAVTSRDLAVALPEV
jgi:Cdc6-like AAA superfamily ATPase